MRFSNYRKFLTPAAVAFTAVAIAACGGGTGTTGNQAGTAGVNFSMQTQGSRNADAKALATKSESESVDDHGDDTVQDGAGTAIALTEVRVHVRDLEFFLPSGIRCEDVQFTFIDPVRCDADDDGADDGVDDDAVGDDDGTPDQGTGDLAKFSESADDGTADQGQGDVGDDGDQAGDDDQGDDNEQGDDDDGDKVVLDGPFVADLLAGTTTPSLTTLLIPAGVYTRIDVRIEEAKEDEGLLDPADPLSGRSLFARGTFSYQGSDHELRIRLKFNEDIRFRNDAGVALSETAANDVVVTLDETAWFGGIDLTGCLDSGDLVLESDGSLLIDEGTGAGECQDIEHTIRDNVEASGGTF